MLKFSVVASVDESPRGKVVESTSKDPEVNDPGLSEGSESDGDLDLSLSDEEDIEINGRSTSGDSGHLRSVNNLTLSISFCFICFLQSYLKLQCIGSYSRRDINKF